MNKSLNLKQTMECLMEKMHYCAFFTILRVACQTGRYLNQPRTFSSLWCIRGTCWLTPPAHAGNELQWNLQTEIQKNVHNINKYRFDICFTSCWKPPPAVAINTLMSYIIKCKKTFETVWIWKDRCIAMYWNNAINKIPPLEGFFSS